MAIRNSPRSQVTLSAANGKAPAPLSASRHLAMLTDVDEALQQDTIIDMDAGAKMAKIWMRVPRWQRVPSV